MSHAAIITGSLVHSPVTLCSSPRMTRTEQVGQQDKGVSMQMCFFGFFLEKALQEFAQHNKSKQVTGELVFCPNTTIVIITVI